MTRPAALLLVLAIAAPPALAMDDLYEGKSCKAAVEARYRDRYERIVERDQCEQRARQAREHVMVAAYERIERAIAVLRKAAPIAADEQRAVSGEFALITAFPPAPYRAAYLRLHADYLRYLGLSVTTITYRCSGAGGAVEYSQYPCAGQQSEIKTTESCADIGRAYTASRAAHDRAVAQLLASKATPGATNWREWEQQRLAALSDLIFHRDRARLANCPLP